MRQANPYRVIKVTMPTRIVTPISLTASLPARRLPAPLVNARSFAAVGRLMHPIKDQCTLVVSPGIRHRAGQPPPVAT